MTLEYDLAYQQAIEMRRNQQPVFRRLVSFIDEVPNITLPIRSDGKWFLATNMMDVVVLPLLGGPYVPPPLELPKELDEIIQSDMATIVLAAQRIAQRRDRKYISATSILIATERTLSELRINEFKLWGRMQFQIER